MTVFVLYDSDGLEIWSIDGVYATLQDAKQAAYRLRVHLSAGKWGAWRTGKTGSPDNPIPFWSTTRGERSFTIMEMPVEG